MDNNDIKNNQSPTVEKISIKEIKSEQSKLDLEENTPVNNFIRAAMALSDEELDKAVAFINKKLEKLRNFKKDK